MSNTNIAPVWTVYEVEGIGPDRFVCATSESDAARLVAEYHASRALDAPVEWIDAGSDSTTIARYRWDAGVLGGVVTVRRVSAEQSAALADIDAEEIRDAAPYRIAA